MLIGGIAVAAVSMIWYALMQRAQARMRNSASRARVPHPISEIRGVLGAAAFSVWTAAARAHPMTRLVRAALAMLEAAMPEAVVVAINVDGRQFGIA
jgi:hypothetical protein